MPIRTKTLEILGETLLHTREDLYLQRHHLLLPRHQYEQSQRSSTMFVEEIEDGVAGRAWPDKGVEAAARKGPSPPTAVDVPDVDSPWRTQIDSPLFDWRIIGRLPQSVRVREFLGVNLWKARERVNVN
ncbi:unnamed protein product [Linum trigynum]|uniref:Uncharacterized protein n=1 Tax=Linum trigynum TaxID=586398 RepID=A0AAV2G714_9ROSI